MHSVRIILYQKPLGIPVSHTDAAEMSAFKPHFVCFPEYFFVNRKLGNHVQTRHNQRRQMQRIERLSRLLDAVVIGGTMPELNGRSLHNTSFVYAGGEPLGFYRKRNLFFAEEGKITPGDSFAVFSAHGITFGVLICADVFSDESFHAMRRLGARIIFIPTFSPRRVETVEEKYKRDSDIFVRGARLSDALIVKVCGVKSEYRDFLQARSLVADKTGVLFRVPPEGEDTPMIIKFEGQL
jgi:hypothetical protein